MTDGPAIPADDLTRQATITDPDSPTPSTSLSSATPTPSYSAGRTPAGVLR